MNSQELQGLLETYQSELKKLSQQALDELRNISHHMYPHALEQFGLSAALESLCNKIDRESSIFIDANIEVIEVELSLEKQLQIYRIAQEAITNTLKHAQASSIILIFHKQGNQLELNIKDNGRGFQKIAEKAANSFGLRSIYERTQLLGGNISIISAPGQGTNTILTVPII